ncbi:MAG: MarR family transcriptional regulator [Corynebacteriales bacterium]|nr:MarR family transcriptional regulator [Mycobacteriales bacterium]
MTWDTVSRLYSQVEGELTAALQRGHGVGISEYRALEQLTRADDGELRMAALGQAIGLNQSSVTRLVGRLEAAGLAYRDLCPADGRGVYAVVTKQGRAKVAETKPTYRTTLKNALDRAKKDPSFAPLVTAVRASV